jgi:hypothetical protein
MSNKMVLVTSLACLMGGLLLGAAAVYLVESGRNVRGGADRADTSEFIKLGETGERAFSAYRHETKPVAIYELSQYLAALQKAEDSPGLAAYMPKGGLRSDMMLTHARLAKLYAATDQPSLSTQHIAQALECAKTAGPWSSVKNWTALEQRVARIDRNAKD